MLHLLTKCSPVQTVRHLAVLILSALKTTIDAARAAAAESIGEPLPALRVHSEHVMTLALQRSGGCSTAATSATARAVRARATIPPPLRCCCRLQPLASLPRCSARKKLGAGRGMKFS